jgi:hypothetical protein
MTLGSIGSNLGAPRSERGEDHMSTEAERPDEAKSDRIARAKNDFMLTVMQWYNQECLKDNE